VVGKIVIAISIYIVFIFPIFISFNVYFDKEKKKVYFLVYLFNFIKIFSGFIEENDNGFLITFLRKKQKLIRYKNLFSIKNHIKPLKDYNIISFKLDVDYGKIDNLLLMIVFFYITNYFDSLVRFYLCEKKPYLVIKKNFNLYKEKNVFTIHLRIKAVFNLLMILLSLIKIVMEKLIYARKNSKQNKYST
jgi:hypothetical protein